LLRPFLLRAVGRYLGSTRRNRLAASSPAVTAVITFSTFDRRRTSTPSLAHVRGGNQNTFQGPTTARPSVL
jgi:hypothetical protein